MVLAQGLELAQQKLSDWATQLLGLLPNLVLALIVVGVFWVIAKLAKTSVSISSQKLTKNKALRRFIPGVAYLSVFAVGIFIALGILQLDKALTSLLAGVGIAGVGLSFAFKDILTNFVSGIIMILNQPFRVGDLVNVGGHTGTVEQIYLRSTTLRIPSGEIVSMPNEDFLREAVMNYSAVGKRRVEFDVGVSYGDDLDKVEKIARKEIKSLPFVRNDDGIDFFYLELAGSSVNLRIRFWIDFEASNKDYFHAKSEAIRKVKRAFDNAGIIMPYPTTTLEFNPKGGRPLDDVLKKYKAKKSKKK